MVEMSPLVRRADTGYRAQSQNILREWILAGRFTSGERLNEVDLSREIGISRGPLREALQRLAAEGLVTIVSNRGAFVRRFETREILDLFELRIALEEMAAGLAAERITDAEAAELVELVKHAEDVITSSDHPSYPQTHDVHSRIAELSRNAVLASHLHDVHVQLAVARVTSGSQPQRAKEALDEHAAIVTAIANRNRHLARVLMGDHLRHAMSYAVALMDDDSAPTA